MSEEEDIMGVRRDALSKENTPGTMGEDGPHNVSRNAHYDIPKRIKQGTKKSDYDVPPTDRNPRDSAALMPGSEGQSTQERKIRTLMRDDRNKTKSWKRIGSAEMFPDTSQESNYDSVPFRLTAKKIESSTSISSTDENVYDKPSNRNIGAVSPPKLPPPRAQSQDSFESLNLKPTREETSASAENDGQYDDAVSLSVITPPPRGTSFENKERDDIYDDGSAFLTHEKAGEDAPTPARAMSTRPPPPPSTLTSMAAEKPRPRKSTGSVDSGYSGPTMPPIKESLTRKSVIKEGYLNKFIKTTGKAKRRWVRVDSPHSEDSGGTITYFSGKDDLISRGLIRGRAITEVVHDSSSGSYNIIVKTRGRDFVFTAESLEEIHQWSSSFASIQEAFFKEEYPLGGEMHDPDRAGYLQLSSIEPVENSKELLGRRFVAVKGDEVCVYREEKDFKVDLPLFQLEMKLGNVKLHENKERLFNLFIGPKVKLSFEAETPEEAEKWSLQMEEAIVKGLSSKDLSSRILSLIRENPSNLFCADCRRPNPEWTVVNWGIVVCMDCSSDHRKLGVSYSKVKSILLDNVWSDDVIKLHLAIGNERSNRFWEARMTGSKITSESSTRDRFNFILLKYKERLFCKLHPARENGRELNEALAEIVQTPDVEETVRLLASGADPSAKIHGLSAIDLVKNSEQYLQAALLAFAVDGFRLKNTKLDDDELVGEPNLADPQIPCYFDRSTLKGFLKFGPSRDVRRFCVLADGVFQWFDEDGDSIPRMTLGEVTLVSEAGQRGKNLFEIKTPNQTHLLSAKQDDDKENWKCCLALNFLPPQMFHLVIPQGYTRFEKIIFDSETISRDAWVVLQGSSLLIFVVFEERIIRLNLRKTSSAAKVERSRRGESELCLNLRGRKVSLRAKSAAETEQWCGFINDARRAGEGIEEQLLTRDNVPVIVKECMNYVLIYGRRSPGIYKRDSTDKDHVSSLLQQFRDDATAVELSSSSAYVVAKVLLGFLQKLRERLLPPSFRDEICALMEQELKADESHLRVKKLLRLLSPVRLATLKALLLHFRRISSESEFNKVDLLNLSIIFANALMGTSSRDFNAKIASVKYLTTHRDFLFDVSGENAEKEKREFEGIIELQTRMETPPVSPQAVKTEQVNFSVSVEKLQDQGGKERNLFQVKLHPGITGRQVNLKALERADLSDKAADFAIFESVGQDLERLVTDEEDIYEIVTGWSKWEGWENELQLVVKMNHVQQELRRLSLLTPSNTFGMTLDVDVCRKDKWKKYTVQIRGRSLILFSKGKERHSWSLRGMNVYFGVEKRRRLAKGSKMPGKPLALTVIDSEHPIVHDTGKDRPYIGHSIMFPDESSYFQWMASFLHLKHDGRLSTQYSIEQDDSDSS